ncbi:MAG TPA: V-type ATP synthase subunit D [Acholeplasmataceae bacterium]|jgi:V/A-type H+-transporting ATPase subunit D|nr:V-type ATP synthase subunit D [Acholeplasmataceae bacterium]
MALTHVNPTRMELTRLKRQLATAQRGHKLLKDKQDEMVRQFMAVIKESRNLRIEVEQELKRIVARFSSAKLKMSRAGIYEALMVPTKALGIETHAKTIMNIKVPDLEVKDEGKIDLTYGFAFTPSELDEAIIALSRLLPKMVRLAELEKTCDMLADEIEKTRRRVNAIEHIMIPDMQEKIKYIVQKLDDNERSNIIRLMKSKEIILHKEQREYR